MNRDAHEDIRSLLDAYVEGALDATARERVTAHLAGCPECAAEATDLTRLLAAARELPREREPARDLWPSIRAALPRERREPARRRWDPGWLLPRLIPAAAVLALTFVWARHEFAPRPEPATGTAEVTADVGLTGVVAAMEMECRGTGKQLVAALRERPDTPGAEAAVSMVKGVGVLDTAISETRDALRRDPGNRALLTLLAERYEQKLRLLREAAKVAALA